EKLQRRKVEGVLRPRVGSQRCGELPKKRWDVLLRHRAGENGARREASFRDLRAQGLLQGTISDNQELQPFIPRRQPLEKRRKELRAMPGSEPADEAENRSFAESPPPARSGFGRSRVKERSV